MKIRVRAKLGQAEGQACPPGMRQRVLKRGVVICRLKDHLTLDEVRWLRRNLPSIDEKEIMKRLIPGSGRRGY